MEFKYHTLLMVRLEREGMSCCEEVLPSILSDSYYNNINNNHVHVHDSLVHVHDSLVHVRIQLYAI